MTHPYYFELQWWFLFHAKIVGSFDFVGYHEFTFVIGIKRPVFRKHDRYYLVWNEVSQSVEKWGNLDLLPF